MSCAARTRGNSREDYLNYSPGCGRIRRAGRHRLTASMRPVWFEPVGCRHFQGPMRRERLLWDVQNVQKNVRRKTASCRLPGLLTGSGSFEYLTSSKFGLRRTEGWRYISVPKIQVVNGDSLLRSK